MHTAFHPPSWARDTDVYEVNLRQYTPEGDIASFRRHLPRLADMNVGTLWFMPLTPISRLHRKGSLGSYYACSDHRTLNPEFGDLPAFAALVAEAHALGMKVIIDWVANHTGWDHHWTVDHPDFYRRDAEGRFHDVNGWDDVIDLDYGNPALREAMIGNMEHWVRRCDIDGFRCDMAMLTPVDFWREARLALDAQKPLFWLAELDPLDDPAYMQVFDSAYTWGWMHATGGFASGKRRDMRFLHDTLDAYGSRLPGTALPAWFTSNHDENSWNGTEYEKYGEMALPLAVFSCTWAGLPLLYSGQELPNTKRLAFFDRDPIAWNTAPQLHDFYRRLLGLRKAHPALRAGDPHARPERIATNREESVLAYMRRSGDRRVLVLLNLSDRPLGDLTLRDLPQAGLMREALTGRLHDFSESPRTTLRPWGYAVWTDMGGPSPE